MKDVSTEFDTLCEQLGVWKCSPKTTRSQSGIPTGFAALDAALPGCGWPSSSLSELLTESFGIGELSILLPAFSKISNNKGIVLVAPPFIPYAPALAKAGVDLNRLIVIQPSISREILASAELALRSGACGVVAIWEACLFDKNSKHVNYLALRKLNLAAQIGNSMAILFRSPLLEFQPSPAALRIKLTSENGLLCLKLFKRKGMFSEQKVFLNPRDARLQEELAIISPLRINTSALFDRLRIKSIPASTTSFR